MKLVLLFIVISTHSQYRLLAQPINGTFAAFQLKITPDTIEEAVTHNVTLECSNFVSTASDASTAYIVILKRQDDGYSWSPYAEIKNKELNSRTNENILLTGNIGNKTFLQIVWPIATKETFGQYRCDVLGYNGIEEQSPMLTVVKHNITAKEVLTLLLKEEEINKQEITLQIKKQNEQISTLLASLNVTQRRQDTFAEQLNTLMKAQTELKNITESSVQNVAADIDRRLVNLVADINFIFSKLNYIANISHTTSTITSFPTTTATTTTLSPEKLKTCRNKTEIASARSSWPQGTFGLLMPDTGCPSDTECTEWDTSFYKFDTEKDKNHNKVSNISHLATPVQEKGDLNKTYMYQRFCVVTKEYSNLSWPMGTYCINRGIKPCPFGFHEGWIHYDEEDEDHTVNIVGGVTPYNYNMGNIYYCCRADGLHETPMVLPTAKSFYLYRYKNRCQAVDGMSVTEEFMLFDTENYDNQDHADGVGYHPDGSLSDVNVTLCYYHTGR